MEYVNTYKNVTLYQNEVNPGVVGNHNKVVNLSTGRYICVLSSDDYLDSLKSETSKVVTNTVPYTLPDCTELI